MAADWIKMRGNLWDDPRVARLCDITDQPEAMIVGALYWLWATADQHTADGIMPGLTTRAIDRKTGVPGFADALCDIGWLADHPEGVRIVGFEDHNGSSAKRRSLDAQRKAGVRSVSASDADKLPTDSGQVAELLRRIAELEKEKEKKEDSVAKATDAAAASALQGEKAKGAENMAKAELWQAAVAVLAAGGCPSGAVARSFMGKLVKDYGQQAVTDAVAAAAGAQPADAREYLKATCQRLKGERRDPVTVPSTAAAETAAALAAQAAHTPEPPHESVADRLAKARAVAASRPPLRLAARGAA